jgi:hypothetical protein
MLYNLSQEVTSEDSPFNEMEDSVVGAGLFWEKSTAGWFVLRENYCWLVADKPNKQGVSTGKTKLDRQLGEQRTRENMQGADLSNLNREFLRVFFCCRSLFLFPLKKELRKFKHSLIDALFSVAGSNLGGLSI